MAYFLQTTTIDFSNSLLFTFFLNSVVVSSQPNATVYQVCEQAPKAGQANAYCTGSENGQITAYTTQVAAQLGASTT